MFDRDTVSGRNVSRVKITLVFDGTRKKFNLLFEFYIKKNGRVLAFQKIMMNLKNLSVHLKV